MPGVIPHAESALNQPSHPWTGPQVGRQADCLSALHEHAAQTREVTASQAPRPTRGRLSSDCRRSTFASRRFPAPNAAPINANLARHLDRGKPLAEQAYRAQTSLLEFMRSSGRTHSTSPPGCILGHYLREDQ
jgi:hypothetical protein